MADAFKLLSKEHSTPSDCGAVDDGHRAGDLRGRARWPRWRSSRSARSTPGAATSASTASTSRSAFSTSSPSARIAFYGFMLGGWASGSKYSFLGAMRSAAQLISYEVALGLSLLGRGDDRRLALARGRSSRARATCGTSCRRRSAS